MSFPKWHSCWQLQADSPQSPAGWRTVPWTVDCDWESAQSEVYHWCRRRLRRRPWIWATFWALRKVWKIQAKRWHMTVFLFLFLGPTISINNTFITSYNSQLSFWHYLIWILIKQMQDNEQISVFCSQLMTYWRISIWVIPGEKHAFKN